MNTYQENQELIKQQPFEYMVLWHPRAKEADEKGATSKVIVERETVMASSDKSVALIAAKKIPDEYNNQLDQLEVLVRPF